MTSPVRVFTTFVHDGSAEGFLAALWEALAFGAEASVEGAASAAQGSLLERMERVAADPAAAARLLQMVRSRISPGAARRVYYVALSEAPEAGPLALAYLRLGLRMGAAVDGYQADAAVRRLHALAARVGAEIHRLKGLTRFKELEDGSWWAALSPDYRVLLPVALHFQRRLTNERWALHDVRRGYAVVWDRRELREIGADQLTDAAAQRVSADEAAWAEAWRVFFRRIAVPGRENPTLQARHVPRRYWKHLVELCE